MPTSTRTHPSPWRASKTTDDVESSPMIPESVSEQVASWKESRRSSPTTKNGLVATLVLLAFALGFAAAQLPRLVPRGRSSGTAPRVPLDTIASQFTLDSPFAQPPPAGPSSGNMSESVWDELVPNGLGYFSHSTLAPQGAITTVFHQLHCIYLLRRAHYALADTDLADDKLEVFDFGKERGPHVAHCFDYLTQSVLCAADSTVEPARDAEHGFLGTGFDRQCRDFGALKAFAEAHRMFEGQGFLARGAPADVLGAHHHG